MLNDSHDPLIPAEQSLPELTFKAIVLSIILALVLGASNVFLALKIGTTISASIPASVLALGVLRLFRRSNVLESNLAQTAASAGEGMAAAVAYVLPAMLILRIWEGFPFWETAIITVLGGLLGVFFSIPLRRTMLKLPALRFPEGTAIGNVLKASTQGGTQLKLLVQGGAVGALVSFMQTGLRVISDAIQFWGTIGHSIVGFSIGFAPAPLAAGYIVGVELAVSLLVGLLITWGIVLPFLSAHTFIPATASLYDAAMMLWSNQLRFVGVGAMLVGGIWTLFTLSKPVIAGFKLSLQTLHNHRNDAVDGQLPRTERDMSMIWVVGGTLVIGVLCYYLIMQNLLQSNLSMGHHFLMLVTVLSVVYVLVVGFLVSTVSSYFCGLAGSSNNPISGLLLASILIVSLIYLGLFHIGGAGEATHLAAIVILLASIIAGIAAVSGETIQDLKAGYMVGATPWKQQLMMVVGVIAAAFILGPVLELLFNAYGMAGIYPHRGMDPSQMLAAPQASLMAAVAQGVLTHQLQWNMVIVGAVISVWIIVIDERLKYHQLRLPVLAVGLGLYLPPDVLTPVIIGGFLSWIVKRRRRSEILTEVQQKQVQDKYQNGILMACGMVAGSALMGVLLAIPFVMMGGANALSIVPAGFAPIADILGLLIIFAICVWYYKIGRQRF